MDLEAAMKFGQFTRLAKARRAIRRLEAKEEEMIRFENPARFYLLKELEEEGKVQSPAAGDPKDATHIDNVLRRHS